MHSHLIPGIDDGARTMEDSIFLVREMSKLGFTKLITTPHIQGEFYKNTPEIILGGLEKVREAIKAENIPSNWKRQPNTCSMMLLKRK